MPHRDKTFRVHFSLAQERVCTLRRRLSAGLAAHEPAIDELIEILFGDDYTACTMAAQTLGLHAGPEAILPLVETVLWSDDGHRYFSRQLRCAAIEALERIGHDDDTATNAFLAAKWDPDPAVAERAQAARAS